MKNILTNMFKTIPIYISRTKKEINSHIAKFNFKK